ncbi:MAG: dihydrolipoyl dehydrogenase [Candidatus Omnitrophica bacterium]|jgi:dihydrolipoamide dehydrogenase|nr:dihydrolipoyl dehydrogenase [Candidatus Omnitrophota bacterium]
MRYDLAIIGAGWAGFNAAKKAQVAGLKVALIEKDLIGGTCLNRGCIPTKVLLQSAKVCNLSKKAKNFGITISEAKVNFLEIQARKDKIISQLRQGMEFLLKGVDVIQAEAKIVGEHTLETGGKIIEAEHILIASGSKPIELTGFKFDGKKILTSDDILNLKEIPKSLLIIGGGVIGCEFATLFSSLGSEVTIAEKLPQLLPSEEPEVAKKLELALKKKGIKVNTNIDAASINVDNYSCILVCVGRRPEEKISVDDFLRTATPSIYAAGDCIGKLMLAHYAAYQGEMVIENILHPNSAKKYSSANVPSCIFTDPEVASVGLKESEAKNNGFDIKINKFDFLASGMARILDETEGFIKIITDKRTDKILGASIIGPRATELIGIFTLALSSELTAAQIKNTIFAHPTLSETIHDALK